MDLKVDIVENFFYIPTSDLASAMVATGNINVGLHSKNTPVNWVNDLAIRREVLILQAEVEKRHKNKQKKALIEKKKKIKGGVVQDQKAQKSEEKAEVKPISFEVVWLSEMDRERRGARMKAMSDEEVLIRLTQFKADLKAMDLDLGLRDFEIYLTDFNKIMEDNSKMYRKRMGLLKQIQEEEGDILEEKPDKKNQRRRQEKNRGKENKRNLLLPWTFELSFVEFRGYRELDDVDVEKERFDQIRGRRLELESKDAKKEPEKKKKGKKPEEVFEIDQVEGEGEFKFPIVHLKCGDRRRKAYMHSDKVILGKLDQLIFDISLKDIQLLQKIYTFHFGVFSQHKQGKEVKPKEETEAERKKKEAADKELEAVTANVLGHTTITFTVEKPVRISLVNDFENVFVRSLIIHLGKLEVKGSVSKETKFFVGFQLKIMYYNSGLTSWEPLLEKLNMMIEYSQHEESVRKQVNDVIEEKMLEYDEEKLQEMRKMKKKGKLTDEMAQNFQTGRAQVVDRLQKEQAKTAGLKPKLKSLIKIEQGIKIDQYEGDEELNVRQNETEVMNFNVTIAFLEKVIFFKKVFQEINEERAQLQKDMGTNLRKLLEQKDGESRQIRKKTKKKGEGIVSPARVVNQTGYPIEVEYFKKQVRILEGTMKIEVKDKKSFKIHNTDSFPLFWDNSEMESLFDKNQMERTAQAGDESFKMNTFFYKTISFRVMHPKFGINWMKNLSLNDNFDRKIITKGRQRILSDFRVLCNSRNIGDLKEITVSSQVVIENQLTARGCRRIINIETIHPFGRSIITIKPGQRKFIPFDLVNFESRVYANKDKMAPQNFKFNNFILKERNYKMIFHNRDRSFNFVFKVERDPKFFYLTRLVAVPALSFKNDMPFPCDLFISNGVQQEVITLKQGEFVKKCDFDILNDVTFMAGVLRPEVLGAEEPPKKSEIIKTIKNDPFKRYYFKSKGKLILENGHLGQDYKKILSLYNNKDERTYFSMVRWITPDSYFGFLLYSDSAIINETPYRLHFRSSDTSQNNQVAVVPQMETLGFNNSPQSLVTLLSSKRSTLEIKLRDEEKNKMLFFSTKFSNKITTSGLVNGVFVINMSKQKGRWVQSERHIPRESQNPKGLAQSMFPGIDAPKDMSKRTMENSRIADSQLPQDLSESAVETNFHEMFPSSSKIKASKMYLEIGYKVSLVYSQENRGALATKVVHLCPKTIVSNETDFLLSIRQKNSESIGLSPESKKPIYAFVGENGKNKMFRVSLKEDEETYNSKVEVDFNKGGSISLIMMNVRKNKWKIIRVEMLIEDSYMFVKVSDRTGKKDMIIRNNIEEPIRIFQHKHREDFNQVLLPGEVKEMAWVNPYKDQKIKTEILEAANQHTLKKPRPLDTIPETKGQDSKIMSGIKFKSKVKSQKKLSDVSAINLVGLNEHLFKVVDEMEIEIQNLKKAEVKTKHNRRLTVDIKLVHQSRMIEIETEQKFKEEREADHLQEKLDGTNVTTCLIKIAKMGVSLVAKTNRVRRELFYLYVNGTNFFYEKEGKHTSIQFQVRYLNIDNNYSSQCRFPVLFTCGRSLNEMILKDQFMVNCILKMIEVESDQTDSEELEPAAQQKIMCFDEITLELSPLTMTFEWSIIRILTDFKEQLDEIVTASVADRTYLSKYFLSPEQLAVEHVPHAELDSEWESKNIESSVWIYCNRLNISYLKFVVTFNMNKDESGELSKSEDSYINVVVNTLGGTLLNIDESPLSFKGIQLYYVFESSNGLISLYKQHLLDQAKMNVMRLLGSFDILGNPTNLFGNVGDGVVQFFEKPVEGFKKGPISGIKGIAKGSTALLKNTAAGTLNAISKFTGSLASGLTILSNDKTYQRQRNLKKAKKPKGVTEGLKSGAQSIGKGVWSGVTGIVTQPIKEVKRSGAIGIFKGIFKGITGVITKPLGGILDATSQTTEGIKKTITKNDDKANEFKQRPPRVFYTDKNVIKVYDNEHAKRIKALVKVDPNMENESLIDSVQLSLQFKKEVKKCILVITNNYFVILNATLSKIHISCEILDVKKVEFELKTDVNGKLLLSLILSQTTGHWENLHQIFGESEGA